MAPALGAHRHRRGGGGQDAPELRQRRSRPFGEPGPGSITGSGQKGPKPRTEGEGGSRGPRGRSRGRGHRPWRPRWTRGASGRAAPCSSPGAVKGPGEKEEDEEGTRSTGRGSAYRSPPGGGRRGAEGDSGVPGLPSEVKPGQRQRVKGRNGIRAPEAPTPPPPPLAPTATRTGQAPREPLRQRACAAIQGHALCQRGGATSPRPRALLRAHPEGSAQGNSRGQQSACAGPPGAGPAGRDGDGSEVGPKQPLLHRGPRRRYLRFEPRAAACLRCSTGPRSSVLLPSRLPTLAP